MPAQLTIIMRRLTRTASGFTTGQKVLSALVLAGLLLGGIAFARWASAPSYAPLFSNLAASDASAIVDKLDSAGVKYQLADGGQTILVPKNDVYAERLKMSGEGLPSAKNTGYSLLDQQGVTASQFQQQVAYQRALEGELANTIQSIDGVQTAVVHLAIPQQDVFLDDTQKPSASVLVGTASGAQLSQAQVQSIVHLVSSSIEGMDSGEVTLVDGNGNLLSAAGDSSGSASLAGATRDQQTGDYETRTASAVQALLDKVLGPGHAVAKVTASLDLDDTNTTTETMIQPSPSAPPLSYSKSSEIYGNGSAGSGATGVLGPDNIAVPTPAPSTNAAVSGGTGTTGSNGYSKINETVDNPYGKKTEQRKSTPGTVLKQSIAVVVDSSVKNANLTTLQQAVSTAAGVDTARGDTISVTSMPFDTTAAATAKKQLAAAASAKSRDQFFGMIKTASVVLLVLLVLGLAFLMSRKKTGSERELLELERIENAQRMPMAIGAGAGAGMGAHALPSGPELGGASPELTERRQAVHALVERQPDEVAELLRGWLADRRG
jgi:flagellar M-ring protein FliF